MPEGVEVKISQELIKPLLINKYVISVSVGDKSRYRDIPPEGLEAFNKSFEELTDVGWMVSSVTITDVQVKGKFMYWTFDNGWYMYSTFGMSGQWSPSPGKHICLKFKLLESQTSPETYMYFNDPRHFGAIKFTNNKQDLINKLNELGWDPLSGTLDKNLDWIVYTLSKTKKPIGQILMDQSIFAGVGNYIRAEALYHSGISPWRKCNLMSRADIEKLCKSIISVMEDSYAHQGATIYTYKDSYGEEGKYSSYFKVYNQKIDPNGFTIIKEDTPEGRTIHWCPSIQK